MNQLNEPINTDLGDIPDSVRNYIEQLETRLTDSEQLLEKRHPKMTIMFIDEVQALKQERDALEAHVDRIYKVAESKNHGLSDLRVVIGLKPATSLAERDAEVARKAYCQGSADTADAIQQGVASLKELSLFGLWSGNAGKAYADRVNRGE